jgi:hypothetical protein
MAKPASTWADYDPSWLVALAREQRGELVPALSRCTRALVESEAYKKGDLVLDVLKDGRVGGVEFLAGLL